MYLESVCDQTICVRDLDIEVSLSQNETIHTENSHKYRKVDITELTRKAGLQIDRQWFDSEHYFSLNLFCPDSNP